jgi:hypothetical protein
MQEQVAHTATLTQKDTSSRYFIGMYKDDDELKSALKKMIPQGLKVKDVYSPFPVHGLESIIGMKWTRLAVAAFMYGITGTCLAVLGVWYMMIQDWAMNIGGKPSFSYLENLPAFIPVTFEFTVLCAAHGMAITYLIRNWTLPGVSARNPHPRTTDDHFAVEVDLNENKLSQAQIDQMFKETGAVETFTR